MRFFYDFEFIEDGSTIDIISVGIVNGDGDTYYAVNADAPWERVYEHEWLMLNVWPHLPVQGYKTELVGTAGHTRAKVNQRGHLDRTDTSIRPLWLIANEVREFLNESDGDVELWADDGAYDHVALMQMYGPMVKRPDRFPMYTNDIQQLAATIGATGLLPVQEGTAHNALDDALHVKHCYETLEPLVGDWRRAA